MSTIEELTRDKIVPPDMWGRDHLSTLLYVETQVVDGQFQIGVDPRMRSGRRNFRVLHEEGGPACQARGSAGRAICMDTKSGSRLANGLELQGHDDWHCIQDMAEYGIFNKEAAELVPGSYVTFTPLGWEFVHLLRRLRGSRKTTNQILDSDEYLALRTRIEALHKKSKGWEDIQKSSESLQALMEKTMDKVRQVQLEAAKNGLYVWWKFENNMMIPHYTPDPEEALRNQLEKNIIPPR